MNIAVYEKCPTIEPAGRNSMVNHWVYYLFSGHEDREEDFIFLFVWDYGGEAPTTQPALLCLVV